MSKTPVPSCSTKMVCTIGPASFDPKILEQLVVEGMDIARFNFSHAQYDQFTQSKNLIRNFARKHDRDVKILLDLQGPRIRVGVMPEKGLELKDGQTITFTTNEKNTEAIYISDPYLHEDIAVNHPLYLANGDLELMVTAKKGNEITAKVLRGGLLYSRKGVNVPDTDLTTSGLTEKDMKDIAFGVDSGVDYIALSFVKDATDIERARKHIGTAAIKICSKIERKQAISRLDGIIQASDIIMVARGDLGIEMPLEDIPPLQKEIIKKCKKHDKPAIVATQMLMSMVNHHRPTRAEVSDVANAVFDGAWAVMLSDESAFGKFPVESLQYLRKTACVAELYKKQAAHKDDPVTRLRTMTHFLPTDLRQEIKRRITHAFHHRSN